MKIRNKRNRNAYTFFVQEQWAEINKTRTTKMTQSLFGEISKVPKRRVIVIFMTHKLLALRLKALNFSFSKLLPDGIHWMTSQITLKKRKMIEDDIFWRRRLIL